MTRSSRSLIVAALCATTFVAPQPAAAAVSWIITDTNKADRPTSVDFTGQAWFLGSVTFFGGAGWFCHPIRPEGFLPTVNDSFYIEGGAWIFYYQVQVANHADYSYVGIIPAGGVRWDFHLTRDWTVFATAKLGFRVATGASAPSSRLDGGGSVGAYWKFSRSIFLRLETGNQGLVQAGVAIVM
ncbi:MAG: hypothetical protein HY903_12100 [Deltaproteobacteria bacterium]|nr:hypothetical protein [Deltaproteobacteria bacterium]